MRGDSIIQTLREALDAPRPVSMGRLETFPNRKLIGVHSRFAGKQELRVSLLWNDRESAILIETYDLRSGAEILSRFILIDLQQVPGLLQALLQADVREADLSSVASTAWPELPITVDEIQGPDGESIRVLVDAFNGFPEVKLTKANVGRSSARSREWATFGGRDIRDVGRLVLEAYDAAESQEDSADPSQGPVDDFVM